MNELCKSKNLYNLQIYILLLNAGLGDLTSSVVMMEDILMAILQISFEPLRFSWTGNYFSFNNILVSIL